MSTHNDFLFELGTEELPPVALLKLRDALSKSVTQGLQEADLEYSELHTFAAPRRLAILIKQLADAQPDQHIERRGPPVKAAFDAEGNPSKAALGFAKTNGTTVAELETMKTDKGEWLCFRGQSVGLSSKVLVPEILQNALHHLPIPKHMRWGATEHEFVRPVQWLVMLSDDQVVDAELLGKQADRITYGHRFHSPGAITLQHAADYQSVLRKQGYVIADFDERRDFIRGQIQQESDKLNGIAQYDAALLDEISALVEWPVALVGGFEEQYLALPSEVLITTMQTNQKYVPLRAQDGTLLPNFITFMNIDSHSPASVRQGNERVIRPRLGDAEFFWKQDRKKTLEQRVAELDNVVEQARLGSMLDKTERLQRLCGYIAEQAGFDVAHAERAGYLAKTDLLTDMVGEFASLQGVMGRYYALADGEPEAVAHALEQQYQPRQSGAAVPESQTGQVLSLADKLDSLVGIFGIGMIPTGVKDPYALRRAALGVLRILIEKELNLDIAELIQQALKTHKTLADPAETAKLVEDFLFDRLRGYSLDIGYSADEFEAVHDVKPTKPVDFIQRLQAVKAFRSLPEANSLAAANKRIRNLLRKVEAAVNDQVDEAILQETAEKNLHHATQQVAKTVAPLLQAYDYTTALQQLAALREPVDAFFDQVMVMAEDKALQNNRLALLNQINRLFLQIADISKLSG